MSDRDFEIDSLSSYLDLPAGQVLRMADRGRLPGRKVAGAWRFARADIHRWMELRIGEADESELERLAAVLERKAPTDRLTLDLLMPLEAFAVPLDARTRGSVMASMVDLAVTTGWLWDGARMLEAVRLREEISPTALDNGVALLHPRRPMSAILAQPIVAFGRTSTGLPFGAARGVMTDLFFLLCSVDEEQHLRALALVSRVLNDAPLLAELRAAPDGEAARTVLLRREAAIEPDR